MEPVQNGTDPKYDPRIGQANANIRFNAIPYEGNFIGGGASNFGNSTEPATARAAILKLIAFYQVRIEYLQALNLSLPLSMPAIADEGLREMVVAYSEQKARKFL